MISSPPQQAEHIRGKTLTPESPKPVHYPSPSNIPILEDPMFNEPAFSIDTPASFQSFQSHPQQMQTPSAHSSTSYYAEQQPAQSFHNVAAQGPVGVVLAGYAQSAAYGGGLAQPQDTSSIQNFSALQQQAPAPSYSDASPASAPDTRSAYPMSTDPNAHAQQAQAQSAQGNQFHPQQSPPAPVDYQALLDSLSAAAANSAAPDRYAQSSMPPQPAQSQGNTPASSLPAAPNLPPRPPPQDKPVTHPNYNPNDDIRSYHPHSQKPSSGRGSVHLQPLNVAGTNAGANATRAQQSPSTPGHGSRQAADKQRSETPDDEDIRWPPEINKLYEEFLDDERRFVTDGQWDQFPMGSRLFIGNLPTEKVTKRDIFHRFFRHGKLAQISIKQAYGFVQFMDSASCHKALQAEQGQAVRGRKMHLEISKPQKNTKKAEPHAGDRNNGARRRSRSPDYTRGGTGSTSQRNERYGGNPNLLSPRERDNRRFRDDYRPMRSPSPPRGGRGMRGRERSRDRYERRRSRSRSPRRYRSPSPRRDQVDDLPLPHRPAHQVPDVQVIVLDEGLPRDFIRWVEDSFRQQGLRIDVLILSPRLSEAAVTRRQIVEGVLAIVRLDTASLSKGKLNIKVFDRRGGESNITFNEYADLDPSMAAALVVNSKQQAIPQPVQAQPPSTYSHSYGIPPYTNTPSQPSTYPPTPATNPPNNPDIQRLISSLDPSGLSRLLGAMSGNNQAQAPQPQTAGISPELARLLGSVSTPAQAPTYTPAAQPPQSYSNPYQNAALASFIGAQTPQSAAPPVHTPTQAAPPGQPDMNEIMAQLAKYQR